MLRRTLVLVPFGLLLTSHSACGGGDGGGDGERDAGGDGGADVGDAGGPDGSVGPGEPSEGLFFVEESRFGEDVLLYSDVFGSIVDARPIYHRLAATEGACRLWTYTVADCGACTGLCNAQGDCVPFPTQLSAGTVTVEGLSEPVAIPFDLNGYDPATTFPADLFDAGDEVTLSAVGDEVAAFSLSAPAVDGIELDLIPGEEFGEPDSLRIEDGADLVFTWSPIVPGTRMRLEILSDTAAHGLPVDVMIECETDDTGSMTVPRAFVEAFPEAVWPDACAGHDCPPSSLTRFRSDRTEVGGLDIELRVGTRREFVVLHDAP
jgi:hypothetical protein